LRDSSVAEGLPGTVVGGGMEAARPMQVRDNMWHDSLQRTVAALLMAAQLGGCAGSTSGAAAPASGAGAPPQPGLTRYRLLLRDNPVSPAQAFHCYADCQPQPAPAAYLHCLQSCPGFETTPGVACLPEELPPIAACFTAREASPVAGQDTGDVVIANIAGVVLVVALASVCASSSSTQCSLAGLPPPPH
jgi:hypothetical protein